MMEVLLILGALMVLSQRRTVTAAGTPQAPVSPLSNAALQALLQQQQKQGSASKGGGGGGSMGGGGSPAGAGRSAGNFPPPPDYPVVTPISYSDAGTNAYQQAYNQYYGADPAAPTGASGAIGTVPGTGGPGDLGTAEASITQDSTLAGVLNIPVGDVTLAPQPDTSGDTQSSAFASDGTSGSSQIDTGVGSYDPAYDPNYYLDPSAGGGGSVDDSAFLDSYDYSEF